MCSGARGENMIVSDLVLIYKDLIKKISHDDSCQNILLMRNGQTHRFVRLDRVINILELKIQRLEANARNFNGEEDKS